MRELTRIVLVISCLLVPAIGLAKQPHSWCTTGAALSRVDADSDSDTKAIISGVCANSDYQGCCSDLSGTRWGLTCVQKAADYARRQGKLGGDYCGRYAWAQGPIGTTKQTYPRDFNLVALAGTVNGIRDVEGAIAAKGNVTVLNFHLNNNKREEIALLTGGSAYLTNGTVHGGVQYVGSLGSTNVTYPEVPKPSAATKPSQISFDALKDSLITMSQSLRDHYDAVGAVSKPNTNTLKLAGSDAELNVFKFDSGQFNNTTEINFAVQKGSAAVITVTGTKVEIKWAGLTGTIPPANKLIWNFPDATTLTINGVGFVGSILAPKATATLDNGNIKGTVVVGAANPANVELYMAPLQLGCSGGLCLDKTWSTSDDATIADDGTAADVVSEAGFLQINGGKYRNEGFDRYSPRHRVWYSFLPAQFGRKNKPLFVLFNGGPGTGTSAWLFSFNTGPYTIDPQVTSGIAYNANTWTQFANLLYIDAPATGFSYPLADDDANQTKRDIGIDMDRDAGDVMRIVLRFLERHPALLKNRVVIVGESYGGMRTTLMLRHLYHYAEVAQDHSSDSGFGDSQLSTELNDYFRAVFGTATPNSSDILTKFGHQVVLQPTIAGQEQHDQFTYVTRPYPPTNVEHWDVNAAFAMSNCRPPFADDPTPCWTTRSAEPANGVTERLPSCDPYACDKNNIHWTEELAFQAGTKLTGISTLGAMLGVNVKTIAWMNDQTRRDKSYGRASTANGAIVAPTPINLNKPENFGSLNADDNYYVVSNGLVHRPYAFGTSAAARHYMSPGVGAYQGSAFAEQVKLGIKTFLSNTKYDAAIWTPSIGLGLLTLAQNGQLGTVVVAGSDPNYPNICSSNNNGIRPGVLAIWWDTYPNSDPKLVTMPLYDSGHTIPMRAPADLLTDLKIWYTH